MITGWHCNNRLPNRLQCYPIFWLAGASILEN